MTKVLQLVQHLRVGGLEKMAFSLANNPQQAGQNAIIALEGKRKSAIREWPELAKVERLACLNKPPKFSWAAVDKLIRIIDLWQIKVIHSHHIGPMLYAAIVKMFRPHVQHVTTVHDAWYLQNTKARWITKLICKFTPITIVADAKAVAKQCQKQIAHAADHIVINGVDVKHFAPISRSYSRDRLGLPQNAIITGCAARVEPGKGHQYLIETLVKLAPEHHLVFAGDGSLRKPLEQLCVKLGVQQRVHWLGCIQDMSTFYSSLDVFCLYSEREGLPLTVLEAMSCNVPVVASDVGAIREVVSSATGVVLPFKHKHLLPLALKRAIGLKQGTRVRQHAMSISGLQTMAGQYNKIYQSITV